MKNFFKFIYFRKILNNKISILWKLPIKNFMKQLKDFNDTLKSFIAYLSNFDNNLVNIWVNSN